MAKVKIEEIIEHLDHDIRRALDTTLKRHFPDQVINTRAVFKTFTKEVYRKCSIWETVPDRYVEID